MNNHLGFLNYIYKDPFMKKISKFNNLKIGTDCSGIEAPLIALEYLGLNYKHEFSCDNDKDVLITHKDNFSPKIMFYDIFDRHKKEIPNIDIYICGFPCQSFSTGGKREGFYKPSNEGIIFFKCLEVIKKSQPKVFILENVKGLLTHEKGDTFQVIQDHLKSLNNYSTNYQVLRTSDYGIPQKRDRLFIIGIRKDKLRKAFNFPKPSHGAGLLDILESTKINKVDILHDNKKEIIRAKINKFKIKPKDNWIINLNASFDYATTCKDISPSLMTTCNMLYLTKYNRFLTGRECLRLQGFPDEFNIPISHNKICKQAGNSMSVNVLCYLFLEIFKCL